MDDPSQARATGHVEPPKTGRGRLRQNPVLRVIAISGWSLLLWGGWACVANLGHGASAALWAGLVQGITSLTITALMTTALELVSRACTRPAAKLLLPTAVAVVLHAAYTIGAHWLAGTPALLATVAPVILLGGIGFSLAYSAALVLLARPQVRLPRLLVRMSRRVGPRAPSPGDPRDLPRA